MRDFPVHSSPSSLIANPQVIELVTGILTIALIVAIRIYALCVTTAATESGWAVVIVRLLIVLTDSYLYSACLIQAADLELVSLRRE